MHGKLSLLTLAACGSATTAVPDTARGAIGAAPSTPQILLPGVVSTGHDDCHATLSPDGKTLVFLKSTPSFDLYTIVSTERRGGAWTRPETVPFSGQYPGLGDPIDAQLIGGPGDIWGRSRVDWRMRNSEQAGSRQVDSAV